MPQMPAATKTTCANFMCDVLWDSTRQNVHVLPEEIVRVGLHLMPRSVMFGSVHCEAMTTSNPLTRSVHAVAADNSCNLGESIWRGLQRVDRGLTPDIVSSASYRHVEAVRAGQSHRIDDVGDAVTAGNQRWMPVDQSVMHSTDRVIVRV